MQKYRNKIGKFGEDLASNFLRARNYRIIGKNIKLSYQEIDLIAQKEGVTVFVEVKTRCTAEYSFGEESLGFRKFKNLKRGIIAYCNKYSLDLDRIRFDLITVNIDKTTKIAKIKHYIELF